MDFDHIDIMNIKAISKRKTPLWKIMKYWDIVDRSYPTLREFTTSINKLNRIAAIRINGKGKFSTLTNLAYKKMSLVERFRYLFNPTEELILRILSRHTNNTNVEKLEINEQEYNEIIKEYYFKPITNK